MDYAGWIQFIFETPLAVKQNPAAAALESSISKREAVQLMTRIFTNCGSELARFSDQQVAEGLRVIGAAGESDWMFALYDPDVPWDERVKCMRSMVTLYRDCFARRCAQSMTHAESGLELLNIACFMWWDVFPSGPRDGTFDRDWAAVNQELISVMSEALEVPHNLCRQSALHGLGHWQTANPQRVHAIVDDWLARNPDLPRWLIDYAKAAREGNVQ